MARFFKDQRVRIVWAEYHPENVGKEAKFSEYLHTPKGYKCLNGEISPVDCDCIIILHGKRVAGRSSQLEPITDSYDLASWDTCIWKPEHLRVKA